MSTENSLKEIPEVDSQSLIKALEGSNIYYFRYLPKTKTGIIPQNTCLAWKCKPLYSNMAEEMCGQFIAEDDHDKFKAMYDAIDSGEPTASAVFRLKDMKTWSRVTINTVKWDENNDPEEALAIVENLSNIKKNELEAAQKNKELSRLMQVFQFAADATGSIVFIFDYEKQSILVSDTTANQWGVFTEQTGIPYGTAESGIVAESSKEEYIRIHEAIMNGAPTAEGNVSLKDADGNTNYYVLSLRQIFDENGSPTGKAAGIYKNITQYQENYQHQYAMTKALSEGIVSAYYIDFDDDSFIIENITDDLRNTVSSYVKKSDKKCFSKTIEGYCHEFVHENYLDMMLEELKNSTILKKLDEKHSYYIQYKVKSNDEKYGYFEIHITDASESPDEHKAFMSFRCIDEQKEREIEHQQIISSFSSIYFASWIINTASDSIIELAVPDYVSDARKDRKFSASEIMDIIVENYVASESDKKKMRKFLNVNTVAERLNGQNIISMEYQSSVSGWCTANIIHVDRSTSSQGTDYVLAIRMIDREKKAEIKMKMALEDAYEAAKRANTAKSDFLSNMSHDIRTPINAIIGMTAIAFAHIDEKEKVSDCLSKITVSGNHLLGIINDVLDMSKIESGKLDLNIEDFDLSELVDNLITMSKPQIEAMNHSLTVDVREIEHELVTGDSQRIQQAFMNLMSNAIKYTPRGGKIRLSITEKPTNKTNVGCYEFIFEDNGIGMTKEFQQHLFEPFSREMNARMKNSQGTGLGMPITKNIVNMMNGSISVESKPGKGTKFTVTIFLALQNISSELTNTMLLNKSVLIADDDLITCENTCDILRELGMSGEWVLSGQDAVDKIKQHDKDYFAVILDWKMPGMDGLETARQIRNLTKRNLPIIIVSAYDWSAIENEAKSVGVDAFVSKPMFKSRIYHTFKSLLKNDIKPFEAENLNNTLENISKHDFSGKRVLLVEDNELNAEIATEILELANIEVEAACNGLEAFDCLKNAPDGYYSMVFMDIQMPVMNGYDAVKAIRASGRKYMQEVPIVAMTANAFAEDVEAARKAGMNGHISKPIDFNQLMKALNKWL